MTSDPLHRQDVPSGGEYGSTVFPAKVRAVCDVGPTLDMICSFAAKKMTPTEQNIVQERVERATNEHNKLFNKAKEEAEKDYREGKLTPSSVVMYLIESGQRMESGLMDLLHPVISC